MQGFHALAHDIEQTIDYMPHDVQGALLTSLTDLHSQPRVRCLVTLPLAPDDHEQ